MESPSPLNIWRQSTLPRVDATEWTATLAKAGLMEIARLRGLLDAAQAVLVGVMSKSTGRDTAAELSRSSKMSSPEARKAVAVAGVVGRVPGAADALASGAVTAEHLLKLVPVADTGAAALLLVVASGMSSEDFAHTVDMFRVAKDGNGVRARQRAARSVRFFRAEEGCIGMRAVLRPIDGERMKAALNAIVDERWRAAHPERAAVAGGHGGDSREQRLADALAAVFGASPPESDGSGESGGRLRDDAGDRESDDEATTQATDFCTSTGSSGATNDPDDCSADRFDMRHGSPADAADADDADDADDETTSGADHVHDITDAGADQTDDVYDGPVTDAPPAADRSPDHEANPSFANDASSSRAAMHARSPSAIPSVVPSLIPASVATRLGVVITINAETLEAAILGGGPLPFEDLGDVFRDVRTEFFAMIQGTNGAILNFGRNRRLATPLQKLAVAVRDGGRCIWIGCHVPWGRCDVDHDPPFESGGRTDVDQLRLMCHCDHHPHRHETGENVERDPSGQWVIIQQTGSPDLRDTRTTKSTAATTASANTSARVMAGRRRRSSARPVAARPVTPDR
jgi:hypothetical protein